MPEKPSKPEDEYFAREERHRGELERLEKAQREREEQRRLHQMKCPKCGADLAPKLFQTVEIDRCTECGGVWLDPGELEKLAGHVSHFFGDLFSFFRGAGKP